MKNNKRKKPIKIIEISHFRDKTLGDDLPYLSIIFDLINREYEDNEASLACANVGAEISKFAPYKLYEFLKEDKIDNRTHDRIIDKILRSKEQSKTNKAEFKKLKRYDN